MKLYAMKIKGMTDREGMVKVIQPTQREKDFFECARRLSDKVYKMHADWVETVNEALQELEK